MPSRSMAPFGQHPGNRQLINPNMQADVIIVADETPARDTTQTFGTPRHLTSSQPTMTV